MFAVLIILFKVYILKLIIGSDTLPFISDSCRIEVLFLFPQVFTFSQKISVNFQLLLRFIQGLSFLLALAGLAVAVALSDLSITDIFACILAFLPTGWGILCVSFLILVLIINSLEVFPLTNSPTYCTHFLKINTAARDLGSFLSF